MDRSRRGLVLRLVVPPGLARPALDVLRESPAVVNVVHLPGASIKPRGDIVLCDVAREDTPASSSRTSATSGSASRSRAASPSTRSTPRSPTWLARPSAPQPGHRQTPSSGRRSSREPRRTRSSRSASSSSLAAGRVRRCGGPTNSGPTTIAPMMRICESVMIGRGSAGGAGDADRGRGLAPPRTSPSPAGCVRAEFLERPPPSVAPRPPAGAQPRPPSRWEERDHAGAAPQGGLDGQADCARRAREAERVE